MQKKTRNSIGQTKPMETHFYTMDFFSFTRFSHIKIKKDSLLFFYALLVFLESWMQKNSKFERADKTNGKPLLHHGFFFSFTTFFLWTFRKITYYFCFCPVSISRIMNAKKTRNSRGKTRVLENHFYVIDFFFFR